jgi:hypothetical protein
MFNVCDTIAINLLTLIAGLSSACIAVITFLLRVRCIAFTEVVSHIWTFRCVTLKSIHDKSLASSLC